MPDVPLHPTVAMFPMAQRHHHRRQRQGQEEGEEEEGEEGERGHDDTVLVATVNSLATMG